MKIELIYFNECPNWQKVRDLLVEQGFTDIKLIDQNDLPNDSQYKLYSSPTLLVNNKVIMGSKICSSSVGACSTDHCIDATELKRKINEIGTSPSSSSIKKHALLIGSGSGFSLLAIIGVCGGTCSAAAIPLIPILGSLGLGFLGNWLLAIKLPLLLLSSGIGAIAIYKFLKRKQFKRAAVFSILLLSVIIFSLMNSWSSLAQLNTSTKSNGSEITLNPTNIETLRGNFNRDVKKVRVISLLSPACPYCVKGFEVLKTVISPLDAKSVTAQIVWMPMVAGDQPKLAKQLSQSWQDPLVSHSWDSERVLGNEFQKVLSLTRTAWDIYLIYKPGVVWEGTMPPKPTYWMHLLSEDSGADPALFLNQDTFSKQLRSMIKSN